jgi:hypothetical protein
MLVAPVLPSCSVEMLAAPVLPSYQAVMLASEALLPFLMVTLATEDPTPSLESAVMAEPSFCPTIVASTEEQSQNPQDLRETEALLPRMEIPGSSQMMV